MNYIIKSVSDESSNLFYCLYEIQTDQPLDFFLFEEDVNKRKTFLESGGGFDGFTPAFMLIPLPVKKNINNEFADI